MNLIILTLIAALCSTAASAANIQAETEKDFNTVARWGVCLVDVVGEDRAKMAVHGKVAEIDAAFAKRYGRRATDVAEELHGGNFVVYYYEAAKAEHDRLGLKRDSFCAVQDKKVSGLGH
jgi:hypothetical protein